MDSHLLLRHDLNDCSRNTPANRIAIFGDIPAIMNTCFSMKSDYTHNCRQGE